MRDIPNLDYSVLLKALKKKSQETMEIPPEQPGIPTPQPTLPGEMGKIQGEMEELKGQLEEARQRDIPLGHRRVLEDKVQELQTLLDESIASPEIQEMIEAKRPETEIMNALNEILSRKRKYEKMEVGVPLEKQLEYAIKEERYEDAQKIQDELNRLTKLVESSMQYLGIKMAERELITKTYKISAYPQEVIDKFEKFH